MSSFVILVSAVNKAFSKASLVRAFNLRNTDFIFNQANSTGLKSGEYTGKNKTSAPL